MDLGAEWGKLASTFKSWPKWAQIGVPVVGAGVVLLIWHPWSSSGSGSSTIETGTLGNPSGSTLPALPILGSYGQVPISPIVSSGAGSGTSTSTTTTPSTSTTTTTTTITTPNQQVSQPPLYVQPGPTVSNGGVKVAQAIPGYTPSTSPSTGDQVHVGEPSGTQTTTHAQTASPSAYQTSVVQATKAFGSTAIGNALASRQITVQQARALALFKTQTGATYSPLKTYQTPVKQAVTAFGSSAVGKAVARKQITVQQARAYVAKGQPVKSGSKVVYHPSYKATYHPTYKVPVTRTYAVQLRAAP